MPAALTRFAWNLLVILIFVCRSHAQNCYSSSSPSFCLSSFRVPTCSCSGNCDPTQQVIKDVNTLKAITSKIEQQDPSSCLFFNSSTISYSPQCCSFPFTLNGEIYFGCIRDQSVLGCFLGDRKWVSCNDPNGYVANFKSTDITIPNIPNPVRARSIQGWIVFQQRINSDEFFDKPWEDYKNGFGNPDSNLWLGLENVYQLCNKGNCQLRVEAYSPADMEWVSEEHSIFFLDSEYGEYAIHYVGRSGDGDAYFSSKPNSNGVINGMRFTTTDKDHDTRPTQNCAKLWRGGWWYNNCCWFNLNGEYDTRGFSGANGFKYFSKSRMMLKVA